MPEIFVAERHSWPPAESVTLNGHTAVRLLTRMSSVALHAAAKSRRHWTDLTGSRAPTVTARGLCPTSADLGGHPLTRRLRVSHGELGVAPASASGPRRSPTPIPYYAPVTTASLT